MNIIMAFIKIIDYLREVYIDDSWNKDNVDYYLTEIQIPVKK